MHSQKKKQLRKLNCYIKNKGWGVIEVEKNATKDMKRSDEQISEIQIVGEKDRDGEKKYIVLMVSTTTSRKTFERYQMASCKRYSEKKLLNSTNNGNSNFNIKRKTIILKVLRYFFFAFSHYIDRSYFIRWLYAF